MRGQVIRENVAPQPEVETETRWLVVDDGGRRIGSAWTQPDGTIYVFIDGKQTDFFLRRPQAGLEVTR